MRMHSPSTFTAEGGSPIPNREAVLAAAYSRLEGAICDLFAMGVVVETVMEDAERARKPVGEEYVDYRLTTDQETALFFSVKRLGDDIRSFKTSFYGTLEETRL